MRRISTTFEEYRAYPNLGRIVEIISDDETFIIVSNNVGELIHLALDKWGEITERTHLKDITKAEDKVSNYSELKKESNTFDCITCLKITPDQKYLIGYWEKKPLEVVKIWELAGLKPVHEEILDLDDSPDLQEDPSKLMVLSQDSLMLYLRSDNRKGVKIISL